jgi:hypothetical protein
MKDFVSRVQKDIAKLQATIQQEGNDLIEKVKSIDVRSNLEKSQKDLRKLLKAKLKKIEPACTQALAEIRKGAKKAGIDLDGIEQSILKKVSKAKPVRKKAPTAKKATTTPKTTKKPHAAPKRKTKASE